MRKYFLTGLLILVPIGITIWVLTSVISFMDQSLLLLPQKWHPKELLGYHIPGLGAILTIIIIFITGLLTRNFIGTYLLQFWENLFMHIPIVRSVYSSVKQVSDTLLSSQGNAFSKALLVKFPHQNAYTIGFLTGQPSEQLQQYLGEEAYLSVYIPTTPNPTSGYFLMLAKKDVVELDMPVEKALKYVVSMGVVAPDSTPDEACKRIERHTT